MHGVWTGATRVHHVHETQLLRIHYHVHPLERRANTVHQLSRGLSAIFGMRTNKAMADRRAKWTNNRCKRLTRQDMKVKITLHYLNKDIGDQDYGTLVEERTKFTEEKLFGDP